MTLINEIKATAIRADSNISELLRMCLVLAHQINHSELREWAESELNGYETRDSLPDYRRLHVGSFGNFVGRFNSTLNSAPIPPSSVPEEVRSHVERHFADGPISSLVAGGPEAPGGELRSNWHADAIAAYGNQVYAEMTCIAAWRLIPRSALAGLVDTVKNRVLSFALSLESAVTDEADELDPTSIAPETVTQIFNTSIIGNVANVSSGGQTVSQHSSITVSEGNINQLIEALTALGVAQEDCDALATTLQAEQEEPELRERAFAWVGRVLGRASAGAVRMGASAFGSALVRAVSQYLGVPA